MTAHPFSPYIPQGGPGALRKVFTAWQKLLETYEQQTTQAFGGDHAYVYTERATLSLLAAAFWGTGGSALEEYSTGKLTQSGNGRIDLFGLINSETAYAFEAKQGNLSITSTDEKLFLSKTRKLLDAAFSDVGKVLVDEAHHRFGLAFCVPYYTPKPTERGKDFKQYLLVETVKRQFSTYVAALRQPEFSFVVPFLSQSPYVRLDGKHYPGVVMVGRERKRGHNKNAP